MRKFTFLLLSMFLAFPAFAHDFEYDGIWYSSISTNQCELLYPEKNIIGHFEIPDIVTDETSSNHTKYRVEWLGPHAFSNCKDLTSIKIPNTITDIREYAFEGCTSLTYVEFQEKIIQDDYSYQDYYWFKEYIFSGCSSLTSFEFPNNCGHPYVPEGFFMNCSSLESINIPNRMNYIGDSAFEGCTSLLSVVLNYESIYTIREKAFRGCTSLKSFTFPGSIYHNVSPSPGFLELHSMAFEDCSNLTSIYYCSDYLCSAPDDVFSQDTYNNATLYLSASELINDVIRVAPWCNFTNIIKSSNAQSIASDSNLPIDMYNLDGVKVET